LERLVHLIKKRTRIEELKEIYQKKHKYLFDLNNDFLKLISEFIGIEFTINLTSKFVNNPTNILDLRNIISPKKLSQKIDFIKYSQVFANKFGFTPNLSIIDLLFNIGPEAIDYLTNK